MLRGPLNRGSESSMRRRSIRSGAFFVFLTCGALFLQSIAAAHLGHQVQRAERYLKLDAAAGELRVVVSLTLGPSETVRVMDAADENKDGEVSRAETDAYMASWGVGLATELPIEIDGERVPLEWGEPYLDPMGPVMPVPGAVEMVARIPISGGRHRIVLRDGMQSEKYDRTDVAFESRDGVTLVASAKSSEPTSAHERLAFGPGEVNAELIADYDFPVVEEPSRVEPLVVGGIAVTLLAVLGLLGFLARREPRDRATSSTTDE